MLISIVTPSYNQARFLDETIQSVVNQDYPHIEYIVIDGESTDNSVDIIRKYEDRLSWWCSEKDKGQADAINKGFEHSHGEILAWLNSDDMYIPGALTFVAEYFALHPEVDMIYGDVDIIDENGNYLYRFVCREYDFKELLSNRLVIPQSTAFFRRHCLDVVGGLNVRLFHALDFDLWVKIGLRFAIQRIKPILARFRVHEAAKSVSFAYTVGPELLKTLEWVFSIPDLPADVLSAKNEIYSGALIVAGKGYYSTGRLKQARDSLLKAIRLYPPQIWQNNSLLLILRTLLSKRVLNFIRSWKKRKTI